MAQPLEIALAKRYQTLAQKKDFLIRLKETVPWQEFRPLLEQIRQKPRKSNAGRKPIDVIVMFKLLVLQKLHNISDEELEYQVLDRFSFTQFVGLELEDSVPDATTVWLFREQLTQAGLIKPLFDHFEAYLRRQGYQAKGGQILDATLVPVPKQHNTRAENKQIKQGEIPDSWQEVPHRLAQKDTDARWTKKNGVSHFGYKDHISVDVDHGLVRCYSVTDAAVHDSQALPDILDEDNEDDGVWADSAYRSTLIEWLLALLSWCSQIHQKGYRNRPLTQQQKDSNREKSSIRARVEHVFGAWVNEMGGKLVRSIGIERAKAQIGLTNLVYNLKRYVYLETRTVKAG